MDEDAEWAEASIAMAAEVMGEEDWDCDARHSVVSTQSRQESPGRKEATKVVCSETLVPFANFAP